MIEKINNRYNFPFVFMVIKYLYSFLYIEIYSITWEIILIYSYKFYYFKKKNY
jgi:hypothetical protein